MKIHNIKRRVINFNKLKCQLLYGKWHLKQSEKTGHRLEDGICNSFNQGTDVHIHNEQSKIKMYQKGQFVEKDILHLPIRRRRKKNPTPLVIREIEIKILSYSSI